MPQCGTPKGSPAELNDPLRYGEATVNNPTGERVVQVQTDEQGRFNIALAPGDYVLHPESPNVFPVARDLPFTVTESTFTELSITYDSGIR